MKYVRSVAPTCALILALGCGSTRQATPTTASSEPTVGVSATRPAPEEPLGVEVAVEGLPPALPLGITSFGAAEHDGDVYLLGGFFGTPHEYRPEGQSRTLWVLRDGASSWERASALEAGLQSVALVRVGEQLHRVGGMRADAEGELHSTDEHARFDPATGRWEALPALPTPRSSHDAIALGDALYVVGGWAMDGAPDDAPFHEAMLRFADGRWETLPGPTPRRALALAATDGHLVAVGGMAPDGSVVSTVEVFDPEAGTWAPGPDLPSPPEAGPGAGFGVAAVGVGDAVYASGRDGALVRWRVGEESWTPVGALRFPRFFHRLVARGEQLLALGGIGGMHTHGRTRLVEAIGTDGERPGRVLLTLPWAGEAKNRQGMFLLGDHLYLFGGNDSLGQHDFDAEHFVAEGTRLHIPSLNVEARAAYPVRRQTMTTVPIDEDTVWLLGGFGHEAGGESGESGAPSEEGETVARTHPEIYAYDAEADAWSLRARLPVARSQAGAVRHGGTLFAIGGLDYDPRRPEEERFDHLTEIVALEEGAEAFAPIDAPLPGPRRAFGGAALGDRYVMVGGMREGFQLVEDCAAFDLEQRAFEDFPCPARPRLNPQLLAVGERLVLLGGTSRLDDGELGEDRSVEVYEDGAWRMLEAELPFTPKHARAFAHRGGVLVVSTHVEEDVIRLAFIDLE